MFGGAKEMKGTMGEGSGGNKGSEWNEGTEGSKGGDTVSVSEWSESLAWNQAQAGYGDKYQAIRKQRVETKHCMESACVSSILTRGCSFILTFSVHVSTSSGCWSTTSCCTPASAAPDATPAASAASWPFSSPPSPSGLGTRSGMQMPWGIIRCWKPFHATSCTSSLFASIWHVRQSHLTAVSVKMSLWTRNAWLYAACGSYLYVLATVPLPLAWASARSCRSSYSSTMNSLKSMRGPS